MTGSTAVVAYLELWGDVVGGGQRSLLDIVTHLDHARYRPIVICGGPGTLVDRLKALGITTHIVPFPSLRTLRLDQILGAARGLRRIFRDEGVRLVHANVLRSAFYAVRAAGALHVPVLWHVRVTGGAGMLDRWLDQWLLRRCARVVTISTAVSERFQRWPNQGRVVCIEHGIDLPVPPDAAAGARLRERIGAPKGVPLIALVGSLEPRKGHAVLLHALPQVLVRHPALRCVMAGIEPPGRAGYQAQLQALASEMGVASHIIWTGFLEDVPTLLAESVCGVFPVVQPEGFGRIVVEAGAVGRPTIATRSGGLADLIEDGVTGLFVPVHDAQALAEALLRLLDDPAYAARLGDAARARARQRYGLDRVMAELQRLYHEVLEEHPERA